MSEPTPESSVLLPEKAFSRPDPAARRARMREFQTRLVDRMQAARTGSDTRAGQLGVLVGSQRCLIDLPQTGEIVSVGTITRVPLTQPWFLGLTNIRGNLISVVDFAQFLGGGATAIEKQSRIIAFASSLGLNSGMLVSQVLGLRNLSDMQLQDEQQTDGQSGPQDWQRQRYLDSEQAEWQLIDLVAITRNPQFLQVAA
ncbi:MAG: chemotaxis protein CheW [Pseudomonadota bacterium]